MKKMFVSSGKIKFIFFEMAFQCPPNALLHFSTLPSVSTRGTLPRLDHSGILKIRCFDPELF